MIYTLLDLRLSSVILPTFSLVSYFDLVILLSVQDFIVMVLNYIFLVIILCLISLYVCLSSWVSSVEYLLKLLEALCLLFSLHPSGTQQITENNLSMRIQYLYSREITLSLYLMHECSRNTSNVFFFFVILARLLIWR